MASAAIVNDFPVPGGPITSVRGLVAASSITFCCASLSTAGTRPGRGGVPSVCAPSENSAWTVGD